MRVALNIACGVHAAGFVRKRISSQFENAGMILNAFGSLPDLYRLRSSPTPW